MKIELQNSLSDMNEGAKEFEAYKEAWKRRVKKEPAWLQERAQYLEMLDEGLIFEALDLMRDDPELFLSLFFYWRKRGLRWHADVKVSTDERSEYPENDFLLMEIEFWRTVIAMDFPLPLGQTNLYDSLVLKAFGEVPVDMLTEKEKKILIEISLQEVEIPYYSMQDLLVGRYAVTNVLWDFVMGKDDVGGATLPKVNVNWWECIEFCNKLSSKVKPSLRPYYVAETERELREQMKDFGDEIDTRGADAGGYRLLDQEQWWFVSGDQHPPYPTAWFAENSDGIVHPIGQMAMNKNQTFDMAGNVSEWTETQDEDNPRYISISTGNADSQSWAVGVGSFDHVSYQTQEGLLGFRICRTLPPRF